MNLIGHIPGVGPTANFNPGPNTPAPWNVAHTGGTDGTGPANATKNMAEIYNRLLLQVAAVIQASGQAIDNDNWAQLAGAIVSIASGATPDATDVIKGKVSLAIAANYPTASDLEAATSAYVIAAITALSAVPGRNVITNGAFQVNQEVYLSGTVGAAGTVAHDFWKAGAAGGDYTFVQLTGAPTTITIAANKTRIQVISPQRVKGGTYVLSWTGTAQARVGVNTATPAGAYAAGPIIIAGQTAGTFMSVEFGNGAAIGTLGQVQLELGNVPTAFEFRDFLEELQRCKSRLQKSYSYGTPVGAVTDVGAISCFPGATGASGVFICAQLDTEMEATPAWTVYSTGGASGNMRDNSGTDRAASISFANTKTASFSNAVATNLTVHMAHYVARYIP